MRRLFAAFDAAGHELVLVGGAVRDVLMGGSLEALADLDFATDASPDESLAILERARIRTHAVGKRFGTVGAVLRGPRAGGYPKDVQITTFRPTVEDESKGTEWGGSLEDDLSRRDFAMNAVAMRESGDIVNPYDGRADIEARRVRSVGDAERMLRDDPLRLLRIGRFVGVLGFEVDPDLLMTAEARATSILAVSRERWLQEMNKLLVGPYATQGLEVLRQTRVLAIVLPEVQALVGFHESCLVHHKDLWAHTLGVLRQTPADPVLRWTALVHDVGKAWTRTVDRDGTVRFIGHEAHGAMLWEAIAARFRIDRRSNERIGVLVAEHGLPEAYTSDWSDAAIRRFAKRAGPHLDDLLTFASADLTTRFDDKRDAALARLDELERRIGALARANSLRPTLPTGLGNAVIEALGIGEGPEVGAAIERVREAIIEGRLPGTPTIAECLGILRDE